MHTDRRVIHQPVSGLSKMRKPHGKPSHGYAFPAGTVDKDMFRLNDSVNKCLELSHVQLREDRSVFFHDRFGKFLIRFDVTHSFFSFSLFFGHINDHSKLYIIILPRL